MHSQRFADVLRAISAAPACQPGTECIPISDFPVCLAYVPVFAKV